MTWLNFISGHVILCQLLVRSGKSQLNNYANAHCFSNISIDLAYVILY